MTDPDRRKMTATAEPAQDAPLCGHGVRALRRSGYRAECGRCGSFWDLEFARRTFDYDGSYPVRRSHFDHAVGRNKARSLRRWLQRANVSVAGKVVCESGFGGGFLLSSLAGEARAVYGIEAIDANIAHARSLGIPDDRLLHAARLPDSLPDPVDIWLFCDSFEHLEDPRAFVEWLRENSTADAEILIVAPRADSLSQRLLGRLWPHKIADHRFHWSRAGIQEFMAAFGFSTSRSFYPVKYVSLPMALRHLAHKLGVSAGSRLLPGSGISVPFNIGEMGLLFSRQGGQR